MNKKGFTLLELLAVLIILALIAVIAIPAVTKLIKGAKDDTDSIQLSSVEKALKIYIASHGAELSDGDQVCISDLKSDGLLENKDVINPGSKDEYTGCFTLTWDISNKQFKYTYSN